MPPILLLHLSDLHFGPHSRFPDEDRQKLGESFHRAIAGEQKKLALQAELPWLAEQRIDLVFVTGDVAETGKRSEFDQGRDFLTGLAGAIGIGPRQFVFVPGNHDVNWASCKRAEAELEEQEKLTEENLRRRLDEVKFDIYESFLKEFYGVADLAEVAEPLGRGARLYRFPDFRLVVAALDSCEKESHRPGDHVGQVSHDQTQAGLDALRRGDVASWLKVVAVHHNPERATQNNLEGWRKYLLEKGAFDEALLARYQSDALGLEGYAELKALAGEARAQLVLHGHQHATDKATWDWKAGGHTHVFSAGSLSLAADVLPKDEPASARLIVLDPENERLLAYRFVYLPWHRVEGSTRVGGFALDLSSTTDLHLDLPDGYAPLASAPKAPGSATLSKTALDSAFVEEFRRSFHKLFDRWDIGSLGAMRPGGVYAAEAARLDDMYLELRFAAGFDPTRTDRGYPLLGKDLINRMRPLALCGVAGAGKTTWSRYTFQQLVDEPRALPLMLVLREVAHRWQDPYCKGEDRSIRAALENWIGGQMGPGWKDRLEPLLLAKGGQRPILIIDGWDELGSLGEEFRGKLMGFLETHPLVLAVVTSRPYGEGRPTHADEFETLEVQPLADVDIQKMTSRFFRRFSATENADREAQRFSEALRNTPEARDLARTPLLLTMMLLIGESEPLPDRRHQLYEQCVKAFLHTRPATKAKDGALTRHLVYCPEEVEQRKRWVAELAFRVQTEGYKKGNRAPIVRKWQEMRDFLPVECADIHRDGFLAWLIEIAGLLIDRSDGTLSFGHLSFQEYLTAVHLSSIATDDAKRSAAFRDHVDAFEWWETLRLLAAQIHGPNPQVLDVVLLNLLRDGEPASKAVSFVGTVFADRLGTEGLFDRWIRLYLPLFDSTWPDGTDLCARAWLATRQEERRTELINALKAHAADQTWLGWQRCEMFSEAFASLTSVPVKATTRGIVGALREPGQLSRAGFAAERLLVGSFPLWPIDSPLGALHLWPAHRRRAGLRLQSAAAAGSPFKSLIALARYSLLPLIESDLARDLARQWSRDWSRDLVRYWNAPVPGQWSRNWARDWARDLARFMARDWDRQWDRKWAGNAVSDWARNLHELDKHKRARDWARELARDWTCSLSHDWIIQLVRDWATKTDADSHAVWLERFVLTEFYSFGRASTRSLLGQVEHPENILQALLAEACHCSLDPMRESMLDLSRNPKSLDPLLPALARHIARRSTPADKALLETAAMTGGEGYPEPLCWGLRFIVRGDVLLDDGSFVTLDELAAEAGVAPLPFLEEMEDEMDWGDDESA